MEGPIRSQKSYIIDQDVAQLLDVARLVTGMTKSEIVNKAIRKFVQERNNN